MSPSRNKNTNLLSLPSAAAAPTQEPALRDASGRPYNKRQCPWVHLRALLMPTGTSPAGDSHARGRLPLAGSPYHNLVVGDRPCRRPWPQPAAPAGGLAMGGLPQVAAPFLAAFIVKM
ncbi:hypothetical protein BHM03_00044173 [Ensete ventricosum]|nr:hypothetical protein BHM03_00044173 [Ensete ventricosum]